MPHSPGIYIALVLKQATDIEQDLIAEMPQTIQDTGASVSSLSKSESSGAAGTVKRISIKNNLFLDVSSLSKTLQTVLR